LHPLVPGGAVQGLVAWRTAISCDERWGACTPYCAECCEIWGICGEEVDEELAGGAQITSIRSDMHCDGIEEEVEIHVIPYY
jgi:hypothetical protein